MKRFKQEDIDTLKVLSSDYKVPSSETQIAKLSFIATSTAIKEVLMRMFTKMFTQLSFFIVSSFRYSPLLLAPCSVLPDDKLLSCVCVVSE